MRENAKSVTELYQALRPSILRDVAGGVKTPTTSAPPSSADYVLSVVGAECRAQSGKTGALVFSGVDHAAIIQAVINLAGVGGTLAFRADTFLLNTYVQPLGSQTWHMLGATFQPTADVTCLRIYQNDHFKLLGSLNIIDANEVTTSKPAIYVYSMRYAQIEHVFIRDYFNGIDLEGNTSGAGTNENVFVDLYMQVRNRGLNLAGSCHDNKFIQVWVKGPAPDDWATGPGIRVATSGTQGGNSLDRCQILDMNVGLDLPGAFEFWFGTVVSDNAFGNAVYIAGSCERLFFDTVWAASSGNGIYMEGNEGDYPVTAADKIYIGKLYAWLNADYGVRLEGYVQQLVIDTCVVQRNDNVGFAFNRWRNEYVRIGTLISLENVVTGVDASGAGVGCAIKSAFIFDGILSPGNFETLEGARANGAFQNRGTALILNGATTSVVTHGCAFTPAQIWLGHEHAETTGAYVSAKNSTTFTITVPSAVTGQRSVHWQAEAVRKTVGGELMANADIEAGTGAPDYWFASATGATWDSTAKRTGYRSLNLNVSGATADWRSTHFGVLPNREYQVQAVFKGTGSADCLLTIRWFSNANGTGFISEVNATLNATYATWTPVAFQAQSPSGALSADVMFRCPSNTTVNINGDDFSVRQLL